MTGPRGSTLNPEDGSSEPFDAIVVAAGTSRRMGGIDKLEAPLGGRPLIARTIDRLAAAPGLQRIVLVIAPDRMEAVGGMGLPSAVIATVPGGGRRQESVAAGLNALDATGGGADDRVVLIHDGARPFATPALIERVARAAAEHGAAIPVVRVAETLKRIGPEGRIEGTVDRESLAAAQTPQGFRRSVLSEAFAAFPADGPTEWTDEAALMEACRIPVQAIPGEPTNLKVTVPADLAMADALLPSLSGLTPIVGSDRVGLGQDSHPFGPGMPLALGGITIDGAPRLHGHSDGDVALHAVADALLGAAGLGDLGRLFPAGPETPAGIASGDLLAAVSERVDAAGFQPRSVDVTIVAARPRLAAHLDDMREAIAAILQVPVGAVNVKASTGNLAGTEGAGRGISAMAVAVLAPIALASKQPGR